MKVRTLGGFLKLKKCLPSHPQRNSGFVFIFAERNSKHPHKYNTAISLLPQTIRMLRITPLSSLSSHVQRPGVLSLQTQLQATQIRHATKRSGGSTRNGRDSAGRRLGVKIFGGEAIKAGQIVVRQRGTQFHPGENMGIGKDHTLFAIQPGWVRFYSDPAHPKRRFAGVVLNHDDVLPYPQDKPKPRRFSYVDLKQYEQEPDAQRIGVDNEAKIE